VVCSSLENLNRKRFGHRVEKENGIAKGQDLLRAVQTRWLLSVFWEIIWPTREGLFKVHIWSESFK
jgi:hypothetical protein